MDTLGLRLSKPGETLSKKLDSSCRMSNSVIRSLDRLQRLVDRIEYAFLLLGVVSLFLMMVLITVNSLLRYLLQSPITGMYQSVELYFMMAVFYFAIPYVESQGANISADIISRRFSSGTKRRIELFYLPVTFLVLSWVTFLVYERTLDFWQRRTTTTGVVEFPIYISWTIVLIGLILLLIRILSLIVLRAAEESTDMVGETDD
jgi:TRAP-type mannitol/chloroaromatic compound transport system permease small subunit